MNMTKEYIAGFVQADGSFTAVVASKGNKSLYLSLSFTIVQNVKYKEVILEIQKIFGGIGNWYFNDKDNTIRYQVTNKKDLLNVIIPFFMKYQLRGDKLLSYLKFKYIVEMLNENEHRNNKLVLLSLIVIASNLNPNTRLGNKIRYLDKEEQQYVINNKQPKGIDISRLTNSIKTFKQNPLTREFLKGLFDGDGNLTIYLKSISSKMTKLNEEIKYSIGCNFTIVQDKFNLQLLEEIQKYFSNSSKKIGNIYEITDKCFIYKVSSKPDIISTIIPKLIDENDLNNIDNIDLFKLPIMKSNQILYGTKILLSFSVGSIKGKEKLIEILKWMYLINKNPKNLSLEEYVNNKLTELKIERI